MKKIIIAASLLGLSGGAYATSARLEALGSSVTDNYFINDNRSIFLNAAYVNDYADSMNMEWGTAGTLVAGTANTRLTVSAAPKAQAGFLRKSGKYVYGVNLGNESNTGVLLRMAAEGTAGELLQADNVVDVFIGSDTGSMKWGWNLLYTNSKLENSGTPTNDKEEKNMATRLGMIMGDTEAFANVSLGGESKTKATNPTEFDGSLGLHLGGAYNMGANKLVASYKSLKWDQKSNAFTSNLAVAGKYSEIVVGYGNTKDLGNGATLFTNARYQITKVDVATTNAASMTHTVLPLAVGFEAKANDWLTWRGSVSHNLTGSVKQKNIMGGGGSQNVTAQFAGALAAAFNTDTTVVTADVEKTATIANNTAVAAGASLMFGKLTVDGMVGSTVTGTKVGVLTLSNLLTRVAMTYWF
ncbi:MAG: hypothetical protein HN576_10705 [Bacteriovoracaceae bacterium]|jgi:hypothetical protein|nr:hypothetical protein [Bacteriovoracaceae bacterium]